VQLWESQTEGLPHFDRLDQNLLGSVQRYSEAMACDIVSLEDGAAMIHDDDGNVVCIGRGVRFRAGLPTGIGA